MARQAAPTFLASTTSCGGYRRLGREAANDVVDGGRELLEDAGNVLGF
jgi:hypothetical protein